MAHGLPKFISVPARFHAWGSLGIFLLTTWILATRVEDRHGFANGELHADVMERWGTPIDQPAPSVRYVESGTVFTKMRPLGFESQKITIDARMNYRKRGLVYFSGFDFNFQSEFALINPKPHDIDIVFVFPVALDRNKVLLSEFTFAVNGKDAPARLSDSGDRLVYTGRLAAQEKARFNVRFKGRGLDAFVYRLDPSLPAKGFDLTMNIQGGDNFDYPTGVVPAHEVSQDKSGIRMRWYYPALESGVPAGAILPSEKSFDAMIATMARRAWVPFSGFFAILALISVGQRRSFRFYEAYLMSSGFALSFVLVAYLAAHMNFYLAYGLALTTVGALMVAYYQKLMPKGGRRFFILLLFGALVVPSAAVMLPGYTGLIYTLECLAILAALMTISTRDEFAERITAAQKPISKENPNAS